jgi:Ca2+/H+ antiporter
MNYIKHNPLLLYLLATTVLFILAVASMLRPGPTLAPALLVSSVLLGVLWVCGLAVVIVRQLRIRNPSKDTYASSPIAKTLALLIAAALLVSTFTAIESVWLDPSHTKYVYENTSSATGFGAILLVFVLSAIQKDVYWVTRKRTLQLDERQIKERQEVFETSYKLGAFVVLAAAWAFASYSHSLPAVIDINFNAVPSRLYWPVYNVAIALFAIPLLVAAWKRKSSQLR